MLDRHTYGNAERLSPDAPVPVLSVVRQEDRPGGAANVCLDLRALKCEVRTLGLVGDDEPGKRLSDALAQSGCDTSGLVVAPGRPTTVKHNYIGLAQHRHPQKMFRVDAEDGRPVSQTLARQLLDHADDLLAGADVLCLEDYDKGVLGEAVCQGLIERAGRHGIPVLVDPAAIDDYSKYRGATCLTPNRTEAERAMGVGSLGEDEAELSALSHRLLDELQLQALVLTLDKQGAMLLERSSEAVMVPTVARSVYDVTGAGDMVLAMLAGAVGNGIGWRSAVELANVAAGLEVEKFGVVPIKLEEMLVSLLLLDRDGLGKRRTLDQLLPELAAHRQQGKQVVFTNGCFDILHAGHVQFLRQARKQGDLLVVGLNSDASIRRIKGEARPVNQEADRVMVLSELESVSYVVVFEQDTPLDLIEAIRPTVLVKGADYSREQVVGGSLVESYGGRIVLVDLVQGRSTTNIIQRISTHRPRGES